MAQVKVKICGITSLQDALAAVEAGADALGFNFYPKSPRFLTPAQACGIVRRLPPLVSTVAVFVDPSLEWVQKVLLACRMDFLQMHGNETPEFLGQFPGDKLIKGLAVREAASLKKLRAYPAVSAFLLDAYAPGLAGGTGRKFPWALASQAKRFKKPLLLAGGLTPQNVAQAVAQVKPYAVDVASGVEKSPGKKDPAKVRAFIKAAKFT